tara:strand:+ start:780 stop:887 length:108 start_codon:yes stop_codon:yes gene_type:complete
MDFDIKPVINDKEKIAEHKLIGSLISLKKTMGFLS